MNLSQFGPDVYLIAKVAVIFLLGIYSVFALVIVRQVGLMNRTLELGFENVIAVFSYLHLFFAIGLLLISIFVL